MNTKDVVISTYIWETQYEPEHPLTYAVRFALSSERDSTGPYQLRSVAKAFLERGDWNRAIKTLLQITTPRDGLDFFSITYFAEDCIARFPDQDDRLREFLYWLQCEELNPKPRWRSERDMNGYNHALKAAAVAWTKAGRSALANEVTKWIADSNVRALTLPREERTATSPSIESDETWERAYASTINPRDLFDSCRVLVDLLISSQPLGKASFEPALMERLREASRKLSGLYEAKGGGADVPYYEAYVRLLLNGREDLAKTVAEFFVPDYPSPSFRNREKVILETVEQSLQASWLASKCGEEPLENVEIIAARVHDPIQQSKYLSKLAHRYEAAGNLIQAEECWERLGATIPMLSGYTKTIAARELSHHLISSETPEQALEVLGNLTEQGVDSLERIKILIGVAERQLELGRIESSSALLEDASSRIPGIQPVQNRSIAVQQLCLCLAKADRWSKAFQQLSDFLLQEKGEEFRPCYCRIAKELCLLLAQNPTIAADHLTELRKLASFLKLPSPL